MSPITPRDRVLLAIRHQEPDRVPHNVSATAPARRKLEAQFGTKDLDEALGNHIAAYSLRRMAPWEEVRPGHFRDEFGVVWNRTVDPDIGVVDDYLLKERSLEGYSFPNPRDPRRYAGLHAFIQKNPDRFRLASFGFTLFERAWSLREMSALLMDMVEAPGFVDDLLNRILSFNMAVIEELLRHDIDGIMFGDDWGHQRGIIMGPRLWRRFIKPRMARMLGAVKGAGKAAFIHSCGKAQELFPDLIEIGLDVFNPFQPEVMDPVEMKESFGKDLSFFGGMSIQKVLPYGTPREVKVEARRLLRKVGKGGGFIIAPSHELPGDVPLENILAFLEAVREQ